MVLVRSVAILLSACAFVLALILGFRGRIRWERGSSRTYTQVSRQKLHELTGASDAQMLKQLGQPNRVILNDADHISEFTVWLIRGDQMAGETAGHLSDVRIHSRNHVVTAVELCNHETQGASHSER